MGEFKEQKIRSWEEMSRHDKANVVHGIVNGVDLGLYDEDPLMKASIDKLRATPGIPSELLSLDPQELKGYFGKFMTEFFPPQK